MKKYQIILSIFISILYFSCIDKEFLDISETDSIAGDIALKTTDNCLSGLIGAYAGIERNSLVLFNSVLSDELRTAEFYNAATIHEWKFGTSDNSIRDFQVLTPYYRVIDRVNRVLAALPKSIKTSVTTTDAADSTLKVIIKAECLFLRAFAHFELYRFYSNSSTATDLAMPYVVTSDILAKLPRITVGEYFTLLAKDLQDASIGIPKVTPTTGDRNRANDMALAGLAARVALYLKEYPTAIATASAYIAAFPISTRTEFPNIWAATPISGIESAWILPQYTLGSLFRGSNNTATFNIITWVQSEKLRTSFDSANDVRYNNYFLYSAALRTLGRPFRIIKKFQGTGSGTTTDNTLAVKVFRTAEMLLIRAEAYAETGDLVKAAADLNLLRANRILNYTNITFASKEDAINKIMEERYKELCFEGHRMFDLKRRNLAVERNDVDLPAPGVAKTLPAGNFRFILPIYITEIVTNPNIQQNPGY